MKLCQSLILKSWLLFYSKTNLCPISWKVLNASCACCRVDSERRPIPRIITVSSSELWKEKKLNGYKIWCPSISSNHLETRYSILSKQQWFLASLIQKWFHLRKKWMLQSLRGQLPLTLCWELSERLKHCLKDRHISNICPISLPKPMILQLLRANQYSQWDL